MKDKDGFDIQCVYSELKVINERDDEDFVCIDGVFAGDRRQCYCDDTCSRYKPRNQ